MKVVLRLLLAACISVGLLVAVMVQPGAAADECSVNVMCDIGDGVSSDGHDLVGNGSLLLPHSFVPEEVTRQQASTCGDCEWRIVPMCASGADPDRICDAATIGCPSEQLRMRVLVRRSGGPWEQAGTTCIGEGSRPVPVADVAARVRDVFVEALPPPRPRYQPADGGLTNLPVIARSGQPGGRHTEEHELLGYPVEVTAQPSWTWRWGDGGPPLRTTDPGSRWPDTAVSHRYDAPGEYAATVQASWSATFTVDGLGPFEVDGGPVTQEQAFTIVVRDAPAELVGD